MERVIISRCRDPRWNLALEEYLIENGEDLVYLWKNDSSVIIGRNQNPYAECNPDYLSSHGINLVRRKSGGGAVYQDSGNLNITMISDKSEQTVEQNFRFLTEVLKSLGISAVVSGRNDIEAGGRKVSGSAFFETEERFAHHCTMLISVDFSAMENALTPSGLKLQSKGIESVRSRVVNLSELNPDITPDILAEALCRHADMPVTEINQAQMRQIPEVREKAARYGSWEWNFGESPESNLTLEKKFSWGLVKAELYITDGMVRSCKIFTDCLEPRGFEELAQSLEGQAFRSDDFFDTVSSFHNPLIRQDLIKLFHL